jgi:hypothetical protein
LWLFQYFRFSNFSISAFVSRFPWPVKSAFVTSPGRFPFRLADTVIGVPAVLSFCHQSFCKAFF